MQQFCGNYTPPCILMTAAHVRCWSVSAEGCLMDVDSMSAYHNRSYIINGACTHCEINTSAVVRARYNVASISLLVGCAERQSADQLATTTDAPTNFITRYIDIDLSVVLSLSGGPATQGSNPYRFVDHDSSFYVQTLSSSSDRRNGRIAHQRVNQVADLTLQHSNSADQFEKRH